MRRRLTSIAIAALAASAFAAATAFALTGGAQYSGTTSARSSIRFQLAPDGSVIAKLRVYYEVHCSDRHRNTTYTDVFRLPLRADGTFAGKGTYTGSKDRSRNSFTISGKVTDSDATGAFSLKSSKPRPKRKPLRCRTGNISWTAARQS